MQVMDNAPIHVAEDALAFVSGLFDIVGIRLIFMPKYSPELNPCENVFAMCKNFVRVHRRDGEPFLRTVVNGFATVTLGNVFEFYSKCILRFGRD